MEAIREFLGNWEKEYATNQENINIEQIMKDIKNKAGEIKSSKGLYVYDGNIWGVVVGKRNRVEVNILTNGKIKINICKKYNMF